MKKIDLSCWRTAGNTIFLEVKVVLKTHKYCFLKTFLNGLVSQILNNKNRFYLKLCDFCHADDIKSVFSRSDGMLSNFKLQ